MWNFVVEIDGVQYPVRIEAGVMTLPSMSLPLQRAALNYAQNHGYPVERIECGPCAMIAPPLPPAPLEPVSETEPVTEPETEPDPEPEPERKRRGRRSGGDAS